MNKVICDICGTSYSDTATQCPICGCVRPAETVAVEDASQENSGYTYVKGGRFSKANVRKRNKGITVSAVTIQKKNEQADNREEKAPVNNKKLGLIIVLICLLLVVISMFIYIGITMANNNGGGASNAGQEETKIPCTSLNVLPLDISMTKAGEVYKLEVTSAPADTTDTLSFSENSGGKVVTVDQNGNVTCVGNGKAVITVICGDQKKECRVTCVIEESADPTEPTEPQIIVRFFSYNAEFTFKNQRVTLYATGDVTAQELTWVSEDPSVATVDNDGIVYAVSNGETDVHAKYNGQILATCHVKCEFKDLEVDNTQEGGETEPLTEFYFGSIYGELKPEGTDLYGTSLKIGDEIQFGLIHKTDRSKSVYFKWERVNPDDPDQSVVTSEDGLYIIRKDMPNISGSYCLFKATYEGKEYFLKVRYLA